MYCSNLLNLCAKHVFATCCICALAESVFPNATGLTYQDGSQDIATVVLVRGNRYVEPEQGWLHAGRKYVTSTVVAAVKEESENKTGNVPFRRWCILGRQ